MTAGLTVGQHRPGSPDAEPPGEAAPAAPVARRVLIVSADIGGGHDATGRALQERVGQVWPGSIVRWVDALAVMGPGVGPAFRRTYVTNVEVTPWLYEFFYASLWRHRRFASAAKQFVGAWAGRRLAPVVTGFDPDLILSTYPLGSAGLAWLRHRRGLGVPVGAWISDVAPHPFWVYPQLDLNLVVHPGAVPLAAGPLPARRWRCARRRSSAGSSPATRIRPGAGWVSIRRGRWSWWPAAHSGSGRWRRRSAPWSLPALQGRSRCRWSPCAGATGGWPCG